MKRSRSFRRRSPSWPTPCARSPTSGGNWKSKWFASGASISAQQQLAQTDLQQRTQQLEQREAEIDARENALAQMQAELRNTQREVLEMRLATEETWAQLSGALAPASLTRSIGQVRSKLADHYRTTIEELAERSEQLELGARRSDEAAGTLQAKQVGDERLG